jgi:hypothetical protein
MVSQKGTRMEVKAAANRIVFRLRWLYKPYMLMGHVVGIYTRASPSADLADFGEKSADDVEQGEWVAPVSSHCLLLAPASWPAPLADGDQC